MSEVEVSEVGRRRGLLSAAGVAAAAVTVATEPIRLLDRALIKRYGIFEYTNDPDCLLRVALTASPCSATLSDGTAIARGETVAELHLWSQRTTAIFRDGVSIRAGLELRRRMTRSFTSFAEFMLVDSRFASVPAILVRTSSCEQFSRPSIESFSCRWGFEIDDHLRSPAERFRDFWDNVYLVMLALAYPSGPMHGNVRRPRERVRIWISRARFLELHCLPDCHAQLRAGRSS